MDVYIRGIGEAKLFFERLSQNLNRDDLLVGLGIDFEKDVKQRISTRNYGMWPDASKWIRAKKGIGRALQGVERYVKFRVMGKKVQIYGDMPESWTLTQHHFGFENKLYSDKDKRNGSIVTIDLVNPAALPWVKGNRFAWKPTRRGNTPARKIWPDLAEAEQHTYRIASRWLAKAVREAGGRII